MARADFDPDVRWIASQPSWLSRRDGSTLRRHAPDYLLQTTTGYTVVEREAGAAARGAGRGRGLGVQRQLGRHAAEATEALAVTGRFLAEEMAPRGRERDAVGRDHYTLASRRFLGATIDLDDTYAWGWDELARTSAEMGHAARQEVPDATGPDALAVAAAIRALDADPKCWVQGKDASRGWMQDVSDRAVAQLDGVHVDLPAATRTLECCLAPTDDVGIYYTAPL